MQALHNMDVRAAMSRTAVLVSADASFRQRLAEILIGMRWKVREASGGAEALSYLEESPSEALLLDFWLPDLEAGDFAEQLRIQYPNLDLICVNEAEEMMGKTPIRSPPGTAACAAPRPGIRGRCVGRPV